MSDLISAQEAVVEIVDTAIQKILSGEQKLTKEYEQSVKEAVNVILNTARRDAQADIVRCKDCKHGSPNGRYGCRVYHYKRYETYDMKPDDFCSFAERREDG